MKIITTRPHRLFLEVIRRIGACLDAGGRCMLLVPSQQTLQAETEIMERLGLDGTFMIDVLSPGRLKSRVFERAGAPARTVFDERGKRMVLSAIIEEEKENLTVYRAAAQQSATGLAGKMSALIADLKRSGKTAQDVLDALDAMDDAQRRASAGRKLADAARIYAAYERRMAGQLADAEDVSGEMLLRMARSGVLDGQQVFVYGFDMITPTFAKELIHMDALAQDLTLFVETDANAAPDGRLFAPVNLSLARLESAAREQKTAVAREHIDAPLDAQAEICAMEARLFALGAAPVEDAPARIRLRAVSGMRQEVHLAASQMRRMALEGADLSGVTVMYPRGSGYAPLLASVLPQYGIEAYIAEKRPAGAHPLCRFVLSALSVVSGGWRAADVVECVQSGFMNLTRERADRLVNYIEGMDVRASALKKPFAYIKDGGEEELSALNESRAAVVAPLERLQAALAAAKDAEGTIAAVIALLEDVGAFETLEMMRQELEAQGLTSEAQDCAQVWNALMDTLDQLHTLLGGSSASGRLTQKLLESGLSALELAALPPAQGAVVCGEIGNLRTARPDTLFVLGMNDAGGEDAAGILTAQEQQEVCAALDAYLGMSASEQAALAQLDELKALSTAKENLMISYALADETGRALREGACAQAMKKLFPALAIEGGAEAERESMLAAPDAALEALSVRLCEAADGRGEMTAPYRAVYAAMNGSEAGKEKLRMITRRLGEPPHKRIEAKKARELYGRPVMSVSRLEAFAQCPYRHFVRYGLAPKEKEKPGVDRAEIGTLYHEAAERFTRAVTALDSFPNVDGETCDRLMDEAVTPLLDAWRQSPLGESGRGAAVARRVRSTARRAGRNIVSQFEGSAFRPMQAELCFGKNGMAPIMLELPGGAFVYLQGRIDRIDVMETGEDGRRHVRVVDYKSGAKKLDPTMVYFGIQLQLILYLAAALAQMPGASPAGLFYCRIADPTIKTESRIVEEVERQIAKQLALTGISLSDVSILRAQDARHAAMVTKDGKPSGTYKSSMISGEGMEALVAFARGKAAQLAGGVYGGEIDSSPAVHEQFHACEYCAYSAVCGFDEAVSPVRRLTRKRVEDLTDGKG